MKIIGFAAIWAGCLIVSAGFAISQDSRKWIELEGMTSADLAANGWALLGSAGLSSDEGPTAIVTFWEQQPGLLRMRCVDQFIYGMLPRESVCSQPVISND